MVQSLPTLNEVASTFLLPSRDKFYQAFLLLNFWDKRVDSARGRPGNEAKGTTIVGTCVANCGHLKSQQCGKDCKIHEKLLASKIIAAGVSDLFELTSRFVAEHWTFFSPLLKQLPQAHCGGDPERAESGGQ